MRSNCEEVIDTGNRCLFLNLQQLLLFYLPFLGHESEVIHLHVLMSMISHQKENGFQTTEGLLMVRQNKLIGELKSPWQLLKNTSMKTLLLSVRLDHNNSSPFRQISAENLPVYPLTNHKQSELTIFRTLSFGFVFLKQNTFQLCFHLSSFLKIIFRDFYVFIKTMDRVTNRKEKVQRGNTDRHAAKEGQT